MKTTSCLATLVALVSACVYPTDKGAELHIEVAPIARMIRGDSVRVHAQLLGADGLPIPNARFTYSSADKSVVVVTADGLVTAVNSGTTHIAVQSVGTGRTPVGEAMVSVSATISLDSLRPAAAKWGQIISLYGTGLAPDSSLVVTIEDAPLSIASYQPEDPSHPERFGVLHLLVTPPLETGGKEQRVHVVATSSNGAGALEAPLSVEPVDLFEPNTLSPTDLGTITGPREFLGLAMEASTLGPSDIDWYTFTTTAPGDWTIEGPVSAFFSEGIVGADLLRLPADSARCYGFCRQPHTFVAYYPGRSSSVGGLTFCRGRGAWWPYPEGTIPYAFEPSGTTVRNVPAGRHDILVAWGDLFGAGAGVSYPQLRAGQWAAVLVPSEIGYTPAVRYDLVIRPTVQSGPVQPDAFEPNDFCEDSRTLLTLGLTAFVDSIVSLTFDRPYDPDWFTVHVQTAGILRARYSVAGTPDTDPLFLGTLVTADSDSAIAVGDFNRDQRCGFTSPWLSSIDSQGCRVEGATVQPGTYYLEVTHLSPDPAPYQLIFSWEPGAAIPAPRVRRSHP